MKKLIVIPAYNESENIVFLIRKLKKLNGYDVLVVNDCSQDTTSILCKKENVLVVDNPCNMGIGGTVQTGYKYALENNYDIVIQVDGDGQHDPQFLDELVEPIQKGVSDFVIGSRFINNEGFQSSRVRRMGITFFSKLISLLTKQSITDPTSGFRAAGKEVIYYFAETYPTDYPEPESIVSLSRLGFRINEIPVEMLNREGGESSINTTRSIYYMVKVTLAILIDLMKNEEKVLTDLKNKVNFNQ